MQNFTFQGKSVMAMQTKPSQQGKKNVSSTWMFLCFLFLSFTFLGSYDLQAQSTKPDPAMYPFCPNCNSKDIKASKITYLPETPGECSEPGSPGMGRFQFDLDVTANTRYGLLIYFDVFTTAGVQVGTYFDCMTVDLPKGPNPITRNSGEYKFHFVNGYTEIPSTSLEAKHVFTAWDNRLPDQVCAFSSFNEGTGVMTILDCQKVAPKCKTYETLPLINLFSKPSLKIPSDISACDADNSIYLNFTDLMGGDLYTLTIDGVTKVTDGALSTSPIVIDISALSEGVYDAILTIKSSISGCESDAYEFNIHIGKVVSIDGLSTNKTECIGASDATVELSVTASGEMLTYQWYSRTSSNGAASVITDATASAYMAPISAAGINYYYVVVGGLCGADQTSSQVSVTVNPATEIKTQPSGQELCKGSEGATVGLSVSAVGTALTYQWYAASTDSDAGNAIPDATTNSYDAPADNASTVFYYVIVDGDCGAPVKSDVISVVINPITEILTAPADAETCLGSSVELSVTATGKDLMYQWYSSDGSDVSAVIADATTSAYAATGTAIGNAYYFVVVSGGCGDATSTIATVHVKEGLSITAQPEASVVCKDGNASPISVGAVNAISYQWYKSMDDVKGNDDDMMIDGATNPSFTPEISGLIMYYYVVVNGECEDVKSAIVSVEVVECGSFCTYSQGGFGSPTGSTHYKDGASCEDETTLNAIKHAIAAWNNKIVLGGADASLTIDLVNAQFPDVEAAKVIAYLPAGGSASGLPSGNHDLQYFIDGKIQNSLLAQTLTLALNIGLNMDNNIMSYPLQAKYLKLDKAVNCGIEGSLGETKCADFTMVAGLQNQDAVEGISINDVWIAANKLLNDPTTSVGISLGEVTKLVEAINLAWDECRIAKQWVSSCDPTVVQPTSLDASIISKAYPNPYRESFTIDFVSNFSGSAKVEIFDITGRLMDVIYKADVIAGVQNKVFYNSKLNTPNAIIYKITVGQSTIIGRMISVK